MNTFLAIHYFIVLFSLVNFILYLKSFVRNNKAFRFFTYYLGVISLVQLIMTIIGKGFHLPNLYMFHFLLVLQFVTLSFFYYQLLGYRWIFWTLVVVSAFLGFQYFNEPDLFFRYNPLGMTITQSILTVYSILYLYKALTQKGEFVIVNIGIFIYLLSSTLIFASGNLVFNLPEDVIYKLINVNRVLTVVFHTLIFIEWFKNYRHLKTVSA